MKLTREQIEKVALLARLELSEAELETMTAQLGQIVEYVEQLNELHTDDVEPLAHAIELSNVLAADHLAPSLERQLALANAPKHDGQYYLVPAVLGD